MNADLIERLIQSGTPIPLAMEVAAEFGRLQGLAEAAERPDAVAEKRRAWDREYRASKRAEARMSGGSGGSRVDAADKVDEAPAPNKRNPQTPKKINPTPGVIPEPAREAEPEVPVLARLGAAQVAIAMVLHGAHLRRWKNVPPPAGVTAEQWRGFLDYRKARRQTLTDRAYQLLCGKLAKHADDDWPPGAIVDHMVFKNWLSFEPEWLSRTSDRRNGQRTQHHSRPSAWAPAPGLDGFEPASLDDA